MAAVEGGGRKLDDGVARLASGVEVQVPAVEIHTFAAAGLRGRYTWLKLTTLGKVDDVAAVGWI